MQILTTLFIVNATLLLLHEIESSYLKEWELLKLPGGITGFLLLHIPIIVMLLWGSILVEEGGMPGTIAALLAGAGGTLPFFVHKVIVRKKGYFDSKISNYIIYLNLLAGIATFAIATKAF